MNVTQVPRSPFLPQSKRLLAHLLRHSETPGTQVLEVGCGEESCLVEHLAACWPDAVLDQIDARPEVIPIAQKRNPRGTVRQLNIADMSGVENNSYDAIVAMSVFDQNPLAAMEPIAKELHRVLRPGGIFAYIHNEEVNAPAASASAASLNPPKCILPNDRWHPNNDFEYCVGRLDEVRATLGRLGSDFDMLRKYVEVFHPSQEQLEMTGRKIQVPAVKQLTIPVMAQMRRLVSRLRDHIELEDRATPSFLDERIVDHLLSESSGFQVLEAGMFELWRFEPWQSVFTVRPSETYFVRNVAKFAYCDSERPATRSMYSQELAEDRDPDDGDVVLVSYQYGAAAKKIA